MEYRNFFPLLYEKILGPALKIWARSMLMRHTTIFDNFTMVLYGIWYLVMVMLYVVLLPSEINYELATITIIPYNRYIIKVHI